jgi:hypothetical protein
METPGQLSLAAGATHVTTAEQFPGSLLTLMLAGQDVNTGAWLSLTVTVNVHNAVLPLASVAVYEMVVIPIENDDPLGKPAVCAITRPGQLSEAAGATHPTTAVHAPGVVLTEMLAGQEVNTGNWLSLTVTVNVHVLTFPYTSVAVNTMLVTPMGKADPEGKPLVCTSEIPGQLSVATGATQLTVELHRPGVLFTTILAGHEVNTGFSLSVTVTVNAHTLVLPLASVAVNEILVTPIGNNDPLTGPAVCATLVPGQLSVAAGAGHDTMAPHVPGLLVTEIFPGHEVNVGA